MAPTNRRNKKANNTIKIQRLQKQLDNLQQMNDCKHKRCYLAVHNWGDHSLQSNHRSGCKSLTYQNPKRRPVSMI